MITPDGSRETFAVGGSPVCVRVSFARALASVGEARSLQAAIAQACLTHGVKRVMLDYRGVGAHTDEVRQCMWDWARDAALDGLVSIVDNELTRVRLNMTALSKRVGMRAFLDETDAIRWLTEPPARRRTTEIKM